MAIWFSKHRNVEHQTVSPAPSSNDRSWQADALHVFSLMSFALAQPVYDRLSGRPSYLIDRQISLFAICLFVGIVSFVLPAIIVMLEWVVSLVGKKAYAISHGTVVFLCLMLVSLPVLKRIDLLTGLADIIMALVLSGSGTWAYFQFQRVRSFATVAAAGIVVFPVLFLYYSPFFARAPEITSVRTPQFQPVPVVVFVLDEFCGGSLMTPEREIDATRFPNFAALAREGTWFRNATSVSPITTRALPAILSGRYPVGMNEIPTPIELPQNLFSVLGGTGQYQLAAFEPVSLLAPTNLTHSDEPPAGPWGQVSVLIDTLSRVYLFHVTPSDYQILLPAIPRLWFGLNHEWNDNLEEAHVRGVFRYGWAQRREDQFRHFLKTIDGSPKPTLNFMHMLLPHMPWCFFPSSERYAEDGEDWHLLDQGERDEFGGKWGADELEVIHSQQRYLLQVMYLDRLIGQLVARLKETGVYDRCLLIVTADHGISFRPGLPRRHLVAENEDEILSIPLFVKRPGQVEGGTSDQAVESVDILPTIADVVGIKLNAPVEGWSMFDPAHPARKQKKFVSNGIDSTLDPARIVESITGQTVRRRFGAGTDPESIFRVGPAQELIGRPIKGLEREQTPAVEIEFSRFGDVMDHSRKITVPSFFEGRVVSPTVTDEPVILAVSINGTIRGVTHTYQKAGFQDRWSVLVPESSFHLGKNDVRFYSVTGTAPNWQLSLCATKQQEMNPEIGQAK